MGRRAAIAAAVLFLLALGPGCRGGSPPQQVRPEEIVTQDAIEDLTPAERFQGTESLGCNECHARRKPSAAAEAISFSHGLHLPRGGHCQTCHPFTGKEAHGMPGHPACFLCHDDARAPRECVLCHRDRAAILPASHRAPNFARTHGRGDTRGCTGCHARAFCDDCHQIRLPHPAGFAGRAHAQAAQGNPRLCARCHPESECAACHQRRKPATHTPAFARTHGPLALRDQGCSTCHAQSFCQNCHGLPMPHPDGFVRTHGAAAGQTPGVCQRCHTREQFCTPCHRTRKPVSHGGQWRTTHGTAVLKGSSRSCLVCHTQSACAGCHGLQMPHPVGFRKQHGTAAAGKAGVCQRCHDRKRFCDGCHATRKPASHGGEWLKAHGEQVGKQGASGCRVCHQEAYCTGCHGLQMPHPKGFQQKHGGLAISGAKACARCHPSSFCRRCHAQLKPTSHTAEFRQRHAGAAKGEETLCGLCHGKDACQRCHGVQMPHPAGFVTGHGKRGASFAKDAVCFRCHKREFCAKCHPDRVGRGGGGRSGGVFGAVR